MTTIKINYIWKNADIIYLINRHFNPEIYEFALRLLNIKAPSSSSSIGLQHEDYRTVTSLLSTLGYNFTETRTAASANYFKCY
jgi:hypothetical protein